MTASFAYPPARHDDRLHAYPGITVPDPYGWLEDPDSPETQAWVAAENAVTQGFLDTIPQRSQIQSRLTQLWNFERYGIPFRKTLPTGVDRYFYFKNNGLQNQSVLYVQDGLDGESRVLLDPNLLSEDGTVALGGISVSEDGQLLAYSLSRSGSDWREWWVRDVASGDDLPDHLYWSKFSQAAWSHDHQGFYYGRYDAPQAQTQFAEANYFQKLYYHRIGTPQSEDVLIYHRPDQKEWGFGGQITEDGRYLIIGVCLGTDSRNLLFYQDLHQDNAPIVELISDFEAGFAVVGNVGSQFWLWTDLDAPKGRLIAVDFQNPDRAHWQEIIPEAEETLERVSLINHQFVATYLKDAASQVKCFDRSGQCFQDLPLPGLGSVEGWGGKAQDSDTFYSFTSFTSPSTIYRYDFKTGESTLFRQPTVDFDPSLYETHQVFVPSADGTLVPLFLTHKKGLVLDGQNPTYLYGYGGFNVSLTPSFRVSVAVWLEMGGIYAVANLRGGGEYGEAWHQAGMKAHKQNVFDDFIAAAQWLISQGYTSTPKLAIAGGSNGGLLVGACMTQRPDLFGAALPAVGVMDMLRFHQFTIGWAWCAEYGSPEDPQDFPVLYAYSPLHNLQPGTAYPATLITTADHDDRVVPAHSFKFAAALQAAHGGEAPVLIRIETKAGHGSGKPIAKMIEEVADQWAFLVQVLDIPITAP
ncbi:prolyl oligopeptidase family serine peptidase [Prochlorothrix hollandica]|uniref:prolyl oligopeptidase family serine peptidase n=1 Tax=Prochlorothrix hollandica TaxID=1223 RepID=UPI003340FDAC